MEIFYWYILSNLLWLVIIFTMIKIEASWVELVIVMVVINIFALITPPIGYYLVIVINLLFFITFLYGGISDHFNKKNT